MGLWQRIQRALGGGRSQAAPEYWLRVRCKRCGEEIVNRIDLRNHLSVEYDEQGKEMGYVCRKRLMGSGQDRCFQAVEVELLFDIKKQLVNREITGGEFID